MEAAARYSQFEECRALAVDVVCGKLGFFDKEIHLVRCFSFVVIKVSC